MTFCQFRCILKVQQTGHVCTFVTQLNSSPGFPLLYPYSHLAHWPTEGAKGQAPLCTRKGLGRKALFNQCITVLFPQHLDCLSDRMRQDGSWW